MPKGDQARAHLIGISTAGASPRRMVILIELRTYTVPGCSGSIVSSSHRLAKKKKIFGSQVKQAVVGLECEWHKKGQACRFIFLYAGFFYIIHLIIVLSGCVSNGTKKQNKTKGIANRPNRIVSDQMRRAQAQGHVFGWAKELTRALSERKKKKTICWNYPK